MNSGCRQFSTEMISKLGVRLGISLFFCLLVLISTAQADIDEDNGSVTTLPDGVMFVGLVERDWRVFIVRSGMLEPINEIHNPASAAFNVKRELIAFVDSEGAVKEFNLSTGQTDVVYSNENSRYTQPAYSQNGDWLYVVKLPKGKSRQTQIIGKHTQTHEKKIFVRKRGAQFDPHSPDGRYLYYTTAACVDDCPSMIWELWRRDTVTTEQVQMTLNNAVSRQPFADVNGYVWFSSDANVGEFRIWTMRAQVGAVPLKRTFGPGKDSHPVVDDTGQVFFLRHSVNGASLMQLRETFKAEPVDLPASIGNIRNLTYSSTRMSP